jgi:hypothetical protein
VSNAEFMKEFARRQREILAAQSNNEEKTEGNDDAESKINALPLPDTFGQHDGDDGSDDGNGVSGVSGGPASTEEEKLKNRMSKNFARVNLSCALEEGALLRGLNLLRQTFRRTKHRTAAQWKQYFLRKKKELRQAQRRDGAISKYEPMCTLFRLLFRMRSYSLFPMLYFFLIS